MATDTPATYPQETEENIEATLVALLTASCTVPVEGFFAPASTGMVKGITADTFVSVSIDQSAQGGDYQGQAVPHTYTANIVVHYAQCDDATGSAFREECRRVRYALRALTGDGCSALTTSVFACDEFMLDSTSSSFEAGDNPTHTKAYSATLKGRTLTQTTEANNG